MTCYVQAKKCLYLFQPFYQVTSSPPAVVCACFIQRIEVLKVYLDHCKKWREKVRMDGVTEEEKEKQNL